MVSSSRKALRFCATALMSLLCAGAARGQTCTTVHAFSGERGEPGDSLLELPDGNLVGMAAIDGVAGLGRIFMLTPDGLGGFSFSTLYTFDLTTESIFPTGGLTLGTDGLLYGTTAQGGSQNLGTIFRIDETGPLETLHSFAGGEGGYPQGGLVLSVDGNFYGVAEAPFIGGGGAVFRMDPMGVVNVVAPLPPGNVGGSLVEADDGYLYGALSPPRPDLGHGFVFRVSTAGELTILHTFDGTDGDYPSSGLIQASDGNLYGMTAYGGLGYGTIYRIDAAGVFTLFHEFQQVEGASPGGALVEASDGKLYGATFNGGANGTGTVFRIDTAGSFEVLASFSALGLEGTGVAAALIQSADGNFYGTASSGGVAGLGTVFRFDSSNVLSSVHDFVPSEGRGPLGSLSQATDGKLYGSTSIGGTFNRGTVFQLDLSGAFATIHSFSEAEGRYLTGGPIELPNGNFYGTAASGGSGSFGTFYSLDSTGAFTLLHDFAGDSFFAPQDVILASDGSLYGVSGYDIIRLDPLGEATVLASLTNLPQSGLVEGTDGALYGATGSGGANDYGTVFRVALDGNFSVLHEFTGIDGSRPNGGLFQSSDGYLYGTTLFGGGGGGLGHAAGTVFRVNLNGSFQTLYLFSDYRAGDGDFCNGHLIQASDGSIYGTTLQGGVYGRGAVYRLDPAGNQTILHSFAGVNPGVVDGRGPVSGLLEASDGLLYGTTPNDGENFGGVIFRIDPTAVLPVTAIAPTSGTATGGTAVSISGAGFAPGAVVRIGWSEGVNVSVVGGTEITATTPGLSPGLLHHLFVTNPDGTEGSLGRAFLADFVDVPQADIFHADVEKLIRDGITVGCGSGYYCRDGPTTRAQMAVFLLKARYGVFYAPPSATGTMFSDVPVSSFGAAWIEDLAARGITAGCGGGNFCPNAPVTRAQMAVFLLKTLLGSAYAPPAPSGTVFDDVPVDAFAAAWIEDLASRGITAGCFATPPLYCPGSANTRGQMAVFLVKTFGLP